MTAPEKLPEWKTVSCPTCKASAGEPCGRRPLGVPWGWERVDPHVARRRLAGGRK